MAMRPVMSALGRCQESKVHVHFDGCALTVSSAQAPGEPRAALLGALPAFASTACAPGCGAGGVRSSAGFAACGAFAGCRPGVLLALLRPFLAGLPAACFALCGAEGLAQWILQQPDLSQGIFGVTPIDSKALHQRGRPTLKVAVSARTCSFRLAGVRLALRGWGEPVSSASESPDGASSSSLEELPSSARLPRNCTAAVHVHWRIFIAIALPAAGSQSGVLMQHAHLSAVAAGRLGSPTSEPESLPLSARPPARSSSESDSRVRARRPGRCAAALATVLPALGNKNCCTQVGLDPLPHGACCYQDRIRTCCACADGSHTGSCCILFSPGSISYFSCVMSSSSSSPSS